MTSQDDSRDGKTPSGSSVSGKRPHATLDLKAVEIKDPVTQKKDKATLSQAAAANAPGAQPRPSATSATSTASEKTSGSETASKAKSGDRPAGAGGRGSDGGSGTPPPQIVKRRGGFFGPLLGGIVGALLAVFAGDYALERLGVPKLAGSSTRGMDAVEIRLADLEQQISASDGLDAGDASGSGQVAELSRQVTALQSLSTTAAELAERQAALGTKVDALAQSVASTAGAAGDQDNFARRLANLEEQLRVVSAAAAANPEAGPIPQLTALTQKVSELELALANQAGTPQAPTELDEATEQQLKTAVTSATTAKAETEKLTTSVAGVKSTTNKLDQRVETLRTSNDRLSESVKILSETTTKMSVEIAGLRATLQKELGTVARPSDINAAVTPYNDRIADVESALKNLEQLEAKRAKQARNVVLSLELANLERSVNSGKPFTGELRKVEAAAGDQFQLTALSEHAATGVRSVQELQESFRPIIHAILQAGNPDQNASLLTQIVDQAKSIVRVRRVSHEQDDTSVEAIVARMEDSLKTGNLPGVLENANDLPAENKTAAQGWLDEVAARAAVNTAMARLQSDLKSALSNTRLTPSQ